MITWVLPTCDAWSSHGKKGEVVIEVQPYWSFRDEVVVIDWIAMKDRRIIIPTSLQKSELHHLHVNHMGTEQTRLLTSKTGQSA